MGGASVLHWRGAIPLVDALGDFDALIRARKIRYGGVNNFDLADSRSSGPCRAVPPP
jgi:diketogulonate reductase-like aldo/keto reductase